MAELLLPSELRFAHAMVVPIELSFSVAHYAELAQNDPCWALLDSSLEGHELSRHSYLAYDPVAIYSSRLEAGRRARSQLELFHSKGRGVQRSLSDPFVDLRQLLAQLKPPQLEAPGPFSGGAVGFLGYEAGHLLEEYPLPEDDLGLPLASFGFFKRLLCHDHRAGSGQLITVGYGASEAQAQVQAALLSRQTLDGIRRVEATPAKEPAPSSVGRITLQPCTDREEYLAKVERAQAHIVDGDAFEICLTQRFETKLPPSVEPWALYTALRAVNPAPFSAFLRTPSTTIIAASPERFLTLDSDGRIETRPIKGTRPRGASHAEDQRLKRELAESEKDRAENMMIVDLARNDLGRIARVGSVGVPKLMDIECHPSVFQMVSTVVGELEPGADALDLIRASFPGGSMTGAPKIEAMKIISQLEGRRRGPYAGALGYLDYRGGLDLAMTIRSLVVAQGRCHFGVGGAIVADSEPAAEYEETLDKARALVMALDRALGEVELRTRRLSLVKAG